MKYSSTWLSFLTMSRHLWKFTIVLKISICLILASILKTNASHVIVLDPRLWQQFSSFWLWESFIPITHYEFLIIIGVSLMLFESLAILWQKYKKRMFGVSLLIRLDILVGEKGLRIFLMVNSKQYNQFCASMIIVRHDSIDTRLGCTELIMKYTILYNKFQDSLK